MKMHELLKPLVQKLFFYGGLTFALSCTDHNVEINLPQSACKTVGGEERKYPCEFIIEKITFLDKDGADLITFTGSEQMRSLSRAKAKSTTESNGIFTATFQVKLTLKRVATPSFAVDKGYILGYTTNVSGKRILHTPQYTGDTYGERTKIGQPVTLDMPVGESRDLLFEFIAPYSLAGGQLATPPGWGMFSYFIDNDVTTLKIGRTGEYFYVGSVAEAYFEKLRIVLTD